MERTMEMTHGCRRLNIHAHLKPLTQECQRFTLSIGVCFDGCWWWQMYRWMVCRPPRGSTVKTDVPTWTLKAFLVDANIQHFSENVLKVAVFFLTKSTCVWHISLNESAHSLVCKRSETKKKHPLQLPRARTNIFTLLVLSDQHSKP